MIKKDILDTFFTDTYRTIDILTKSSTLEGPEAVVYKTQKEIADELSLSTITMNSIFKKLEEIKVLKSVPNRRGKYILDRQIVGLMKDIRKLLED